MSVSNRFLKRPVGLRFRPTEEKMLEYLYHKIHGLRYQESEVFDFDLYGDTEPWAIWNAHKPVDDGEDLYFFTKLKRSTIKNSAQLSAHVDRKIGLAGGTWSGEKSASLVFHREDDRVTFGYRKHFRYENPNLPEHHGEWIMHEYTLHENLLREGAIDRDYVLCRIRKNKRKAKKMCVRQPMINNNNKILALKRSQMRTNQTCSRNIYELQPAATTYQEVIAPHEIMTTNQCSNSYDINKGTNDITTNIQDSSEVFDEASVEDDLDYIRSLEELLENDLQASVETFDEDDIDYIKSLEELLENDLQASVEDGPDFIRRSDELLENDLQASVEAFDEDDIDYIRSLEELLENDLQASVEDGPDFIRRSDELLENDLQASVEAFDEDDIDYIRSLEELLENDLQASVEDDPDFIRRSDELLENDLQASVEDDSDFINSLEQLLNDDLQADQSQDSR